MQTEIVVAEPLSTVLLVACALGTLTSCMVSVGAWIYCRPEAVRRLQGDLLRLATAQNELAASQRKYAAEAANDFLAAEHEREIAQDYNKRSASRGNRNAALQAVPAEPAEPSESERGFGR